MEGLKEMYGYGFAALLCSCGVCGRCHCVEAAAEALGLGDDLEMRVGERRWR